MNNVSKLKNLFVSACQSIKEGNRDIGVNLLEIAADLMEEQDVTPEVIETQFVLATNDNLQPTEFEAASEEDENKKDSVEPENVQFVTKDELKAEAEKKQQGNEKENQTKDNTSGKPNQIQGDQPHAPEQVKRDSAVNSQRTGLDKDGTTIENAAEHKSLRDILENWGIQMSVTLPETVDFIEYSLVALNLWLEREYAKYSKDSSQKLTQKVVTSAAALRQMSSMLRPDQTSSDYQKRTKLNYPYLLSAIGDISLDGGRNGYNRRAYRNIVASKNMETGKARAYDIRPVRVALGLVFNTDSLASVIAFASAIIMNAPAFSFIFEGENNFRIGIKAILDPNITIPPVNYETPGEAYQFNTVITLETYIGNINTVGLIQSIRVQAIQQLDGETSDLLYDGPQEVLIKEIMSFETQFKK